jgi:AraC-like DNA-binding protein
MLKPSLVLPSGQRYGTLRNDWSRDGLGLFEIGYAPGLRMRRHEHEWCRCVLVMNGGVEHRVVRDSVHGRQSVVVVPAAQPHEDAVGPAGAACFIVEFGGSWLHRMAAAHSCNSGLPAAAARGELAGILARIRQECRRSDTASSLIVDGLLLELLGHGERAAAASQPPGWIRTLRDSIRGRFRNRVTIAELASEAGVHPVHLCREFRRHVGCTVGTYMRRLRIEYACAELSDTDHLLVQIALDAGFSSQAHFASAFRRATSLSPRAWREAHRGANPSGAGLIS